MLDICLDRFLFAREKLKDEQHEWTIIEASENLCYYEFSEKQIAGYSSKLDPLCCNTVFTMPMSTSPLVRNPSHHKSGLPWHLTLWPFQTSKKMLKSALNWLNSNWALSISLFHLFYMTTDVALLFYLTTIAQLPWFSFKTWISGLS